MFHFTKKKAAVLGTVAAVALTAGAAMAYWTTTGSGTGSASTSTDTGVTVTQTSTVAGMYPGGPAQALDFTITNPGPSAQYIASVSIAFEADWSEQDDITKPACTAADFTLVQPNAINQDLAVGDTAFAPSGASLKLDDTATNQDNCKTVAVPLEYSAS